MTSLEADVVDWKKAAADVDAWRALAARALEGNAFLEPAFALAGARHFPAARRPLFARVWRRAPEGDRLLALCAIEPPRGPFGFARLWLPKESALGTPLLDPDLAAESLAALIDVIGKRFPGRAGTVFPAQREDAPVATLLRALRPQTRTLARWRRAVLPRDAVAALRDGGKHAKELRRLRRRLSEQGALTCVTATTPEAVDVAIERFLALEVAGWKGRRGAAILKQPSLAAFTRAMARRLAETGQCRVVAMELDGKPLAMTIVLSSGSVDFMWKTAYDEAYAIYSPGVQLTRDFSRRQIEEGRASFTDSCAIEDHPMIDRLWPARTTMVDLAVPRVSRATGAFAAAAWGELALRRGRAWAKAALHRLLRRRAS